jgi:hypothetical protein
LLYLYILFVRRNSVYFLALYGLCLGTPIPQQSMRQEKPEKVSVLSNMQDGIASDVIECDLLAGSGVATEAQREGLAMMDPFALSFV